MKPLSKEEREFCIEYLSTDNLSGSYNKVFGEDPQAWAKAKKLIEVAHIKKFLDFVKLPAEEKAHAIIEDQMVWATHPDDKLKAAKEQLKIEERQGVKEATERWVELANQIGAKFVIMPSDKPRVANFESFLKGELILELPLAQSSGSSTQPGLPGMTKTPTRGLVLSKKNS